MVFFLDLTSRRHEVDGKYGTAASLGDLSPTMLGSATSPLLKATINSSGRKSLICCKISLGSMKRAGVLSEVGLFSGANGSKEG